MRRLEPERVTSHERRRWRTRLSAGHWFMVAAVLVFVGGIGLREWSPWDSRQPRDVVRQAVIAQFAADGRAVRCDRSDENDGSIPFDDVDYECKVGEGRATMTVWVGSNSKRITGFAATGP